MENPKIDNSIKVFSFIQESFRKGPIPWIFTVMAILLLFLCGWVITLAKDGKADRAQFRLDLAAAEKIVRECESEKFKFAIEQIKDAREKGKKLDSLQSEIKTMEKK